MPHSDAGGELALLVPPGGAIPLVVGGLPSPDCIFAIHCVVEIVRRTRGQVRAVPLNIGEDGERLAEASSDEPLVVFFDTPDSEARELLMATRAPIVVVTGDFAETARFCMVARDLDALQAARFVSQSFSCLEPLYHSDNVRWVTPDRAMRLPEWIDQVAGWLGFQPSAWEVARQQMLADYAAWSSVDAAIRALVQFADTASARWEGIAPSTEPLFGMLGTFYRSGSIDRVFWPSCYILEPGDPAFAVSGAIPLAGPARIVTFGPFLHLPPGRWSARYQFDVDEHPAGNLMEFDVVNGGKILVSNRVMTGTAGQFGLDCAFEMQESRLPVENRAMLAEGSIGGFFKPLGIWLDRAK